jgi:hypothetical protein
MSDRLRLAAARLYLAVFVAGGIGILWLVLRYGLTSSQQLVFFGYVGYAAVGYLVLRRQPSNSIAWWFMLASALGGVFGLAQTLSGVGLEHHQLDASWAVAAAWLQGVLWLPLLAVSVTFPILVFPSGLYASSRWRAVGWLTGLICLVFVVTNGVSAYVGSVFNGTKHDNPLAPDFMQRFGDADSWASNVLLQLAIAAVTAVAAVAVIRRGRQADGAIREQVRWFGFGAACLVVALLLNPVLVWALGGAHLADIVGNVLVAAGLAMVPLTMGVAILRFRLYDIDRLISRTAAYTVVTAVVLATYAAIVTAVTTLLPDKTSALPVAIATLSAAALFRPLLTRVQSGVDRRFDRRKYDAQRVVDEFGERLRSETDTRATLHELVEVVRRTVAPSTVAVWLPTVTTSQGDAMASRDEKPRL